MPTYVQYIHFRLTAQRQNASSA